MNMDFAEYMTKVDEMKEVSNLNAIMERQIDLNRSMSGMLNKCIAHHKDQLE